MAPFAKGIQTKETLYNAARKLFYEKGYANTTVKDIVIEAGSKLGTFTYHYESKESLAVKIYQDFIYSINETITGKMAGFPKDCDDFIHEIVGYRAFFQCISQDGHVRRFYIEICDTPLFKEINRAMTGRYIRNCLELACRDGSGDFYPAGEINLEALTSIVSGMEIRYIYDLFLGHLGILDFDEAIDVFLYCYYGFFMKNRSRLKTVIDHAAQAAGFIHVGITDCFTVIPDPVP